MRICQDDNKTSARPGPGRSWIATALGTGLVLLAAFGLAACGGASTKGVASAQVVQHVAGSPTTSAGVPVPTDSPKGATKHSALRDGAKQFSRCLQDNGVTQALRGSSAKGHAPSASASKQDKATLAKAMAKCAPVLKASSHAEVVAGKDAAKRRDALSHCLGKNGVSPPKQVPGIDTKAPPVGKPSSGSGGSKLAAALTKCEQAGGSRAQSKPAHPGRGARKPSILPTSEQIQAATRARTEFLSCLREHGVNVPTPGSSGKSSSPEKGKSLPSPATLRAANAACSAILGKSVPNTPPIQQPTPPSPPASG